VEIEQRLIDQVEGAHAGYVAWRVVALGGTVEWLPTGGLVARCDGYPKHWYANRIVAVSPGSAKGVVVAAGCLAEAGLPVRVEVPQPLFDEQLRAELTAAGLAPAWTARALAAPMLVPSTAAPTGIHVGRVETVKDAERFWGAYDACFEEAQPERQAHVRKLAEHSGGVSAYLGWFADEVVGVALMYVRGETALLADAATRPDWRGRGVHALLVAARLADAEKLPATIVTSDVEPNAGSDRNLARLGLHTGYLREVWTF
jgi:hypothetical protein